jgi:hypothetical protein
LIRAAVQGFGTCSTDVLASAAICADGARMRRAGIAWSAVPWLLGAYALAAGCSSTTGDLRTARELYRDARYELAAAWLDALDSDVAAMSAGDRATFHYLRGMTGYRLARYQDALHDLAVAAYVVSMQENALSPTQRSVLERTLGELMPEDASSHARSPRNAAD